MLFPEKEGGYEHEEGEFDRASGARTDEIDPFVLRGHCVGGGKTRDDTVTLI